MAFSGSFFTTSCKQQLFEAVHDFRLTGGDTFKVALYNNTAAFTAATTAYTATNEITGTGYTAGGATITRIDPTTSGTTAYIDYADTTWTTATIAGAYGAMVYNTTPTQTYTNPSVQIVDFGGSYSSTAADFTITWPVAAAATAILRIA